MIRRPSKITRIDCFGTRYAVKRVPNGHAHLTDTEGGTDNFGMHHPDEPAIYLDEALTPERERITLCHELAHAIEAHFGLDLPEEVVDAYGRGILYLVRNNPSLVRFLQRAEAEHET
jgi:hypothetical protein